MEAAKPGLLLLADAEASVLELERQRAQIPQALAAAEARLAAARDAAAQLRAQLEAAEKHKRTREAEAQDHSTKRDKLHGQSAAVKTNKEYTTLLHEIDGHTRRIAEIEDEILGAMETIESASADLQRADASARQVDLEVKKESDELRARLVEVEVRLATSVDERKRLLAGLGSQVEALYARVIKVRPNGIARLDNVGCSGCHRALPPEVMNRVRAGEIHACASCYRILVPGEARPS